MQAILELQRLATTESDALLVLSTASKNCL